MTVRRRDEKGARSSPARVAGSHDYALMLNFDLPCRPSSYLAASQPAILIIMELLPKAHFPLSVPSFVIIHLFMENAEGLLQRGVLLLKLCT
jgi:hypothetical protein